MRKCKRCKKEFIPSTTWQVFDTDYCRYAWHQEEEARQKKEQKAKEAEQQRQKGETRDA